MQDEVLVVYLLHTENSFEEERAKEILNNSPSIQGLNLFLLSRCLYSCNFRIRDWLPHVVVAYMSVRAFPYGQNGVWLRRVDVVF